MKNRKKNLLLLVLILPFASILYTNCQKSEVSEVDQFPFSQPSYYFSQSTKITVNVLYELGAEPFTGYTPKGLNYWSILENNLAAIFQYRATKPALEIPKTTTEMTPINDQNKSEWTASDVLSLHNGLSLPKPSAEHAQFYIYFLHGRAVDSDKTIAFNINGTPIIAVFKDVVISSGSLVVQKFVEQSTLVHESGHVLGFVNNGVAPVTNHQDVATKKSKQDINNSSSLNNYRKETY